MHELCCCTGTKSFIRLINLKERASCLYTSINAWSARQWPYKWTIRSLLESSWTGMLRCGVPTSKHAFRQERKVLFCDPRTNFSNIQKFVESLGAFYNSKIINFDKQATWKALKYAHNGSYCQNSKNLTQNHVVNYRNMSSHMTVIGLLLTDFWWSSEAIFKRVKYRLFAVCSNMVYRLFGRLF